MKKKRTFFDYIEIATVKAIEGLKKFSKAMLTDKLDEAVKVVLYIIMALIMTSLLKIPYEIVKHITLGLISIVPNNFQYIFGKLIILVYNMVYFSAILFTIHQFIVNLPIPKKYKIKNKKDDNSLLTFFRVVSVITSIIFAIVGIVFLVILTVLCIAAFDKTVLVGPFVTIIGLLLMVIASIILIIKNNYKLFYTLLASFIIIFSGISVLSYETNNFVTSKYDSEIEYKVYTYKIDDNYKYSFKLNNDTDDIKVVYDKNIDKEIKVVVGYNDNLIGIENSSFSKNNTQSYNFYSRYNNGIMVFKYIYNMMIDSLKNKVNYDLDDIGDFEMTIYINEEDKNVLKYDYERD